jgi:predicted nucleic acid-binding protein
VIRLEDALLEVTRLGFDTSPLIYFVERRPNYFERARELIVAVDSGRVRGFSSVITLTEVLTLPKRAQNPVLVDAYRTLLLSSHNFEVLTVDFDIAETAAELRARHSLRTPDAIQIAAALSARCEAFVTNDAALKRVSELRVILLDEIEL